MIKKLNLVSTTSLRPPRLAHFFGPIACLFVLACAHSSRTLTAASEANVAPPAQRPPAANNPSATNAAANVPPPSSAPKLGATDLEKLLMPIALYPDPLLATILPASVFPLEIVQAARFLQDTNNASKIDEQPWDDTVKALAKIHEALTKMNDDLSSTIKLGEAFLAQDKDVMDTIQA